MLIDTHTSASRKNADTNSYDLSQYDHIKKTALYVYQAEFTMQKRPAQW